MIAAALVLVGCWVYCILAIRAAFVYQQSTSRPRIGELQAISILKPLAGLDEGLRENLLSYFEQDYRDYEVLFALRHADDPAASVVSTLIAEYPAVRARLVITGEPPYSHAKVYSLQTMLNASHNPLVAMADSDVRVGPDFCRRIAQEFSDGRLAVATCPYRALGGTTIWSRLEAVGMNTEFHAGLLTAVMLEGARFAVGPTIVARRNVLEALGGMERFKDYLAEDFMLGRVASEAGYMVGLSCYVIEHRIGSETMAQNFKHRIRWARSTRCSRPAGYIGQFFTYPLPLALLACLLFPRLWPALLLTMLLRAAAADVVSRRVLGSRVPWGLLVVQDFLAFFFWIAGFFGNSVIWRGRRYVLRPDGTMQLAESEA